MTDVTGKCLVASATAVAVTVVVVVASTAVSAQNTGTVSAEAGDEQNPDNPFAASTVVASQNTIAATVVTAAVVAAAAEQQQDNPNPATTPVISCISTSAIICTTTITQITHFVCYLQRFIYALFYAALHVNVSERFIVQSMGNFYHMKIKYLQ